MNTEEVASLFRRYADEPDSAFLTDQDVALYLRIGYDEFRSFVSSVSPWAYATTIDVQLTQGVNQYTDYDLTQANANPTGANTPSLLGQNPNDQGTPLPRLEKLLGVETTAAIGGAANFRLPPKTSLDGMYSSGAGYIFRDQIIRIAGNVSFSLRLHYVPAQGIGVTGAVFDPTWANVVQTGAGVYIDDFNEFHDLIALMAYDQYAITDVAMNPVLAARREKREMQFRDYLERREYEGTHYVQVVNTAEDDFGGWF